MNGTPEWLSPLLLTLKVAGVATIASFAFGVGFARLLSLRKFPGSDLLSAFLSLPMVLPPTVLGYYLIVLMGRNGIFGRWLEDWFGLRLMFSWEGAALAASVVSFPLVLRSAKAAFEGVDKNLENAARTLGSSELGVFFRVSLPLAWRGILAGTMLAFARAMGEFGATMMIAGNIPGRTRTLSLAVYTAVESGQDALAANLVIITSIVCMAVLVGSDRLLGARAG